MRPVELRRIRRADYRYVRIAVEGGAQDFQMHDVQGE